MHVGVESVFILVLDYRESLEYDLCFIFCGCQVHSQSTEGHI